ncbi:MAG: NfeD family protein [Candidatus Gastranaerophilales bacterium]|nr:NfeD family protein [Candidatus Gastranaerophilales bacterium]
MYVIWAILGIVFLYLDFKKTSTIKLTLAATFLFCSIIAFKFEQNYLYQAFSLPSFGMLFYFLIKSTLRKEQKDAQKEKDLDDFIGKSAVVKKDIGKTLSIDGLGYIEYNNQLWSAKSINDKLIKAGNRVEIVSKENKIMNVKVIENAKE